MHDISFLFNAISLQIVNQLVQQSLVILDIYTALGFSETSQSA